MNTWQAEECPLGLEAIAPDQKFIVSAEKEQRNNMSVDEALDILGIPGTLESLGFGNDKADSLSSSRCDDARAELSNARFPSKLQAIRAVKVSVCFAC